MVLAEFFFFFRSCQGIDDFLNVVINFEKGGFVCLFVFYRPSKKVNHTPNVRPLLYDQGSRDLHRPILDSFTSGIRPVKRDTRRRRPLGISHRESLHPRLFRETSGTSTTRVYSSQVETSFTRFVPVLPRDNEPVGEVIGRGHQKTSNSCSLDTSTTSSDTRSKVLCGACRVLH